VARFLGEHAHSSRLDAVWSSWRNALLLGAGALQSPNIAAAPKRPSGHLTQRAGR
jgi:hypothetical protein